MAVNTVYEKSLTQSQAFGLIRLKKTWVKKYTLQLQVCLMHKKMKEQMYENKKWNISYKTSLFN